MPSTKHKFTIGKGANLSAVKNDTGLQDNLQIAKSGGTVLREWYQKEMSALNHLYQTIATGGEMVWIDGIDKTSGFPTKYLVNGSTSLTIGVYITEKGKTLLKTGTENIETSLLYGYAYMTLVTDMDTENPGISQVSTNMLLYGGEGIPNLDVDEDYKNLIEKTVGVVKKFIKNLIDGVFEAGEVGGLAAANQVAEENAHQAASEAAVEGEEIAIGEGETIVADIGFGVIEATEIVFALGEIAMTIILNLLAKEILSFVRCYNNTNQEIEFSICLIEEDTGVASAPALPQDPVYIPGVSPAWTPPWIIGMNAVHYANLVFGNTDSLKGVGFVLKAQPNGDFPGFNVLINIPNTGDNSMMASFNTDDNCGDYWEKHSNGTNELSFTTSSGSYNLEIATNQISGKSPSPVDGSNGYNYEYIVLLSKK